MSEKPKMTELEKQILRRRKETAREQCEGLYKVINSLRETLSQYLENHAIWRRRFEDADLSLAMDEKLTVIPPSKKTQPKKKIKLTKEQIIKIATELGIDIDED